MRIPGLMFVLALAAGNAAAQDAPAAGAEGASTAAPEQEQAEGKVETKTETKGEAKAEAEKEIPEDFKPTEEVSEDLSTALPADI